MVAVASVTPRENGHGSGLSTTCSQVSAIVQLPGYSIQPMAELFWTFLAAEGLIIYDCVAFLIYNDFLLTILVGIRHISIQRHNYSVNPVPSNLPSTEYFPAQ